MSIIEIYKDEPDLIWQDNETYLCVFDSNNNLIADYDLCTGLKLMQNEKEMTVFINDDDLVAGKWKFFGVKVSLIDGQYSKEDILVNGVKKGKSSKVDFKEEFPWNNCGPGKYVSRKEREERLSVCKLCSLFDSTTLKCTVDNEIVLRSTRYENEYCPEEKWGDKKRVLEEIGAAAIERGDVVTTQTIEPEEQMNFEQELEEYLKGL
jgi:hypothetical protein